MVDLITDATYPFAPEDIGIAVVDGRVLVSEAIQPALARIGVYRAAELYSILAEYPLGIEFAHGLSEEGFRKAAAAAAERLAPLVPQALLQPSSGHKYKTGAVIPPGAIGS